MARVEKTVFISYRRKDISWALAVYQYLTSQKYDVFFDYTSLSGGDFEQVIVGNIKARAHFVLILTPTAFDRCGQPGDWLRREIETAIDEKRNIIPLFFDGFSFGSPFVIEKLTGKLANINRYNGLDVPAGYFMEAMERLHNRYLNVPLNAVLHPVPTEVWKVVEDEKVAADKALEQKKDVLDELVKSVNEISNQKSQIPGKKGINTISSLRKREVKAGTRSNLRPFEVVAGILFIASVVVLSFYLWKHYFSLGIGSVMVALEDGMTLHYVPAGEFIMGSDADSVYEKPAHKIDLDAFWVDQTEITNSMFAIFVAKTGYQTDAEKSGKSWILQDGTWVQVDGTDWSHPRGSASRISNVMNNPVVHVSWNDALAYCVWAERRLPTEAEWEKSASWDQKRQKKLVYPWGNTIDCFL